MSKYLLDDLCGRIYNDCDTAFIKWLLSSVVTHGDSFRGVFTDSITYKPCPVNIEKKRILNIIKALIDNKIIQCKISIKDNDQLDKYVYGDRHVYFWLTSFGGSVWESLCNPRWENYVEYMSSPIWSTNEESLDVYNIRSCNIENIKLFIESIKFIDGEVEEIKNIKYKTETPFNITYWKEFEIGYEAEFYCRRIVKVGIQNENKCIEPNVRAFLEKMKNWFDF